MSMILAIDSIASRYGMLPSHVIKEANTFDLVIMDAAMTYQNHLQKEKDPNHIPDIPVEELLKIKEGL